MFAPEVNSENALTRAFGRFATAKLQDNLANIERCTGLLSEEQLWQRPNDACHSIANLQLHLTGNVRQWINSGLGNDAFERNRPDEFAARGGLSREERQVGLRTVVDRACEVIESLSATQLLSEFDIQSRKVSGLTAVFHVVEHFSLHTGQIVLQVKWLTGRDLSLYDSQGQRIDTPAGSV